MFCVNCGKEIDNSAVVCIFCGAATQNMKNFNAQQAVPQQQPVINIVNTNVNSASGVYYVPKSKWTAFLLCLFFGIFGIHRFYVGKSGTGVLWLLTGGLFGIGWFLDTIFILLGWFRDRMGQPLR